MKNLTLEMPEYSKRGHFLKSVEQKIPSPVQDRRRNLKLITLFNYRTT